MGSFDRRVGWNFEHQPCMVTKESRIDSILQMTGSTLDFGVDKGRV